jgi:hypothetical protein
MEPRVPVRALDQSYLLSSYLSSASSASPLAASLLLHTCPIKRYPLTHLERQERIHRVISSAYDSTSSTKDVSLCRPCLTDLRRQAEIIRRDKTAALDQHHQLLQSLLRKAKLNKKIKTKVSYDILMNNGSDVQVKTSDTNDVETDEESLLAEVAALTERRNQLDASIQDMTFKIQDIQKQQSIPISALEHLHQQVQEQTISTLECLRNIRSELYALNVTALNMERDDSRKFIPRICPLFDTIQVDMVDKWAVINGQRLSFQACPQHQLNYREINNAYVILARML